MAKATTKQMGVPLSRRAFAGLPSTVDAASRSFEIVITTETPVRIWVPDPRINNPEVEDCGYIEVDEVLVVAGMDFSRVHKMPLLDNHDTYSGLRAQIGRVDNVRIDGPTVVGTAVLSNKDAHLLADIQEGFFGQISAGYCHLESELIERADDVPLLRVARWQLHEASLVPVGADPNAFVRGQRTFPKPKTTVRALETNPKEKKPMELEELVTAAEDALAAVVAAEDGDASDEVVARAKRLREFTDAEAAKDEDQARGKRADDPVGEETDEEKKEVEEVRSLARSYGKLKEINDLRKLGTRSAELKVVMRGFISAGATITAADVKPSTHKRGAAVIDTTKIYARANSTFKGRK